MTKLDRYLIAQLLTFFGLFSLVIVFVVWISRATDLFDRIIANGQSALVFVEFSLLTLPVAMRIVLPLSAFVAAVYVANRMRGDEELAVAQAAGIAPWRLVRPVVLFGLFAAAANLLLTTVINPSAAGRLDLRSAEIAEDVTAGLLVEGRFLHPADGLTLFLRDVQPDREMRGIFLRDARSEDEVTYTADSGVLARTAGGPRLVMFDGMVQRHRTETDSLAVTRFEEYAYDLAGTFGSDGEGERHVSEVPTPELLRASAETQAVTGRSAGRLRTEAHERFSQGITTAATPVMGFAILLLGGFSRFGAWRQITLAIVALIAVDTFRTVVTDLVRDQAALWPLIYTPTLAAYLVAAAALALASRPRAGTGRILPA